MRFVYFTKLLKELDIPDLIGFCEEVGLDGVDLAVRPGYPVNPENAAKALPAAAAAFKAKKKIIGLVTAPTDMNDPAAPETRALFDACSQAGVPAIKIGYFPYKGRFDIELCEARARIASFSRLAEQTRVKACYHTHSGGNLGNNAAGLRLLLGDANPHYVGVFLDTGHLALGGGPFRMEAEMVRPWFSLLAIKDIVWEQHDGKWRFRVAPAGQGIVRWDDVAAALKEIGFRGTISLHGEYEAASLDERIRLARMELDFLKKKLA
ncbi:MAG: sugar phosphate isomerase/epimerase [Gemmatales bacterium]|nr:sugar phosphate isomerase/epimerase [Gemmatales bacterium]MDW8387741.1 TIM barrel protein [Gemmatales bacterium]